LADANDLSHFGGCRTHGFRSGKNHSNSFAVPVLSFHSTGIPEMLKLHWLKPLFAQKPPDSS
jgi:hypothetical protein